MALLAPRKNDQDLFAETTMSFGEHLEELRVCLWKAMIGLVLGTIVGLFVGDYVVKMIERPLRIALKDYYKTAAEKEFSAWAYKQYDAGQPVPYTLEEIRTISKPPSSGDSELIYELEFVHPAILNAASAGIGKTNSIPAGTPTVTTAEQNANAAGATPSGTIPATPPPATPVPTATANVTGAAPAPAAVPSATASVDADGNPLTPDEIRRRAVEGVEGQAVVSKRENLVPLLLWHPIESDGRFNLQATGTTEVFSVWLKAALVVGVLIASPWIFVQIWTFVASGLYHHERKYVYTILPFSLGLFLLGASTAYLFVFEPVLTFLFSFNQSLGIDPDPKISEWLSFVLLLPLGFGVSFQLPLVMLFLQRIGVFKTSDYIEKWRIAILAIFIISAVLTPADPYSIFLMAVPLTFLYFGGILLTIYLPKSAAAKAIG